MTKTIKRAEPGELLDTALVYSRIGWKVFPLWWVEADGRCACLRCACPYCSRKGLSPKDLSDGCRHDSIGKHPIHTLAPSGVKNASADEATISGWWELFPWANIGLPAGDNGLAILDVDPDHGGSDSFAALLEVMEAAGSPFPGTLWARTGSGGEHHFFAAPEGGIKNATKVLGPDMPGIDTRGRGGYVVAAPSNHASGELYSWGNFLADEAPWPALLGQLIDPPKPEPVRAPYRPRTDIGEGTPAQRWAQTALRAEIEKLLGQTKGERNDALNRAAFSLGQIIAGGYLQEAEVGRELMAAAQAIGLGETEARKTILSGFRGGASKPRHPQAVAA